MLLRQGKSPLEIMYRLIILMWEHSSPNVGLPAVCIEGKLSLLFR